jgi:hypothetical protein
MLYFEDMHCLVFGNLNADYLSADYLSAGYKRRLWQPRTAFSVRRRLVENEFNRNVIFA